MKNLVRFVACTYLYLCNDGNATTILCVYTWVICNSLALMKNLGVYIPLPLSFFLQASSSDALIFLSRSTVTSQTFSLVGKTISTLSFILGGLLVIVLLVVFGTILYKNTLAKQATATPEATK